jgi:hypothetical protein
MLLATALINKYQRHRDYDRAIMASKEDFKTIVDIFVAVSGNEVSKIHDMIAEIID